MPSLKSKSKAKIDLNGQAKEILYPQVSIKLCDGERDPFLTAEDAKNLLGWDEESEGVLFGNEYTLVDSDKKKVRCHNNLVNRPYKSANAALVKQEILNGRWRLNLESMIVGKHGSIISCQHRLIGLILAVQEWKKYPDRWPFWKTEPHIACLLAFGCDETDEVINTVDTGEPRTLADVIYRSGYFRKGFNDAQRQGLSKVAEFAVRFIWEHTGAFRLAYSEHRTHSESMAFISNHERILEAASFIYLEDGGKHKKISSLVPSGIAAGLLYLMGTSQSSRDTYADERPRTEASLNFDLWDDACELWSKLASNDDEVTPLLTALKRISTEASDNNEKSATMIKAWLCFRAKHKLSAKELQLKYKTVEDVRHLDEFPKVGGIDIGFRKH